MTKYRFSFIVETDKKPQTIFRKVWDAVEEIDRDTFGYYQVIHSHKDMVRILAYVHALGDWDELTKEVLAGKIKEHLKEIKK